MKLSTQRNQTTMKTTLHRSEQKVLIESGNKIKRIFLFLFLLCAMALAVPTTSNAADLVIADKGISNYEIVIPDKTVDEVVDRWLVATAKLMQAAFQKNGFEVPVVRESAKSADKPGIYLGATMFAQKNKIEVNTNDWSYVWKTVGQDVVIIGTDQRDSDGGKKTSLALLGTVKGALDFLREYAGVRFLFLNFASPVAAGEPSSLDTHSIAFVPQGQIKIPEDLNVKKTPPLRARSVGGINTENFYTIALNYFPQMDATSSAPSVIKWNEVIPLQKYGKSHPEYFALLSSGKRASVTTADYQPGTNANSEVALDVTNPQVLNLMYGEAEKRILGGAQSILFLPLDSFLLSRCNCDRCNEFFGIGAMTPKEVKARVDSGKIWQIYISLADRLYQNYPQAQIVVWDYQEHRLDPRVVQKIPVNLTPKFQFGSLQDFNRLDGIEIPGGIVGLEETFTGFGIGGPYAPERTPKYAAQIAQAMVKHKVQWTSRDGAIGYSRGLSAPAYYVYGRMLDDPTADYQALEKEFYEAAFGRVAPQMSQFFDLLYQHIALYSDYFGIQGPALGYARQYDNYNKWLHQSIYTVEFMTRADALLKSAERRATDPDVKARLGLIRIEFDYLTELSQIMTLQDDWTLHPTPENLNVLLNAVDQWHQELKELAGGIGGSTFEPLKDWPQMRPFSGHAYLHAALNRNNYQNGGWKETAIGWDTDAIRSGTLSRTKPIEVASVEEVPALTSDAWKSAPTQFLRAGTDMPMASSRTTLQLLHDQNHLYVRINSGIDPTNPGNATKYIERMAAPTSEKEVRKQEYVELSIQPHGKGKVYRLAATPTKGTRYDATVNPEEDDSWDGQWEYEYQVSSKTPGRTIAEWTAWFKIPFSDFGASTPAKGETWKFDAGRMQGDWQSSLTWQGGRFANTDPAKMGGIEF